MFDVNIPEIINKFYSQAEHIPFENSDFQNLAFVVSNQQTPERMLRAAIMKQSSILSALTENNAKYKRDQIKLRKLKSRLEAADLDPEEKELIEIDLEEMQLNSLMTEKLVKDATHSYHFLQGIIDSLPKIESRQAFELAEPNHFDLRFNRQLDVLKYGQAAGAIEGQLNMMADVKSISEKIPEFKLISEKFYKSQNILDSPKENPLLES